MTSLEVCKRRKITETIVTYCNNSLRTLVRKNMLAETVMHPLDLHLVNIIPKNAVGKNGGGEIIFLNAATRAINDIKLINKLSLETALQLFKLKIDPIATYGLEGVWTHLKKKSIEKLEKLKSTYLKKVLSLSKYTRSRLVYELSKETFYIEDLRLKLLLPATPAYQKVLRELYDKKTKIWEEFYSIDAMVNREWTRGGYDLWHIVTRFAVHGFHHRLCCIKNFHEPSMDCVCERCGSECGRYHAMNCRLRTETSVKFCTEN